MSASVKTIKGEMQKNLKHVVGKSYETAIKGSRAGIWRAIKILANKSMDKSNASTRVGDAAYGFLDQDKQEMEAIFDWSNTNGAPAGYAVKAVSQLTSLAENIDSVLAANSKLSAKQWSKLVCILELELTEAKGLTEELANISSAADQDTKDINKSVERIFASLQSIYEKITRLADHADKNAIDRLASTIAGVKHSLSELEREKASFANDYDDDRSDALAADHALVKLQVYTGSADVKLPNLSAAELKTQLQEAVDQFLLRTDKEDHERIGTLAQMEHNRWSAELLMRNANWVENDKKTFLRADGKLIRRPENTLHRQTLCPWDQMPEAERTKDVSQVWFLLNFLSKSTPTP